MVTEVSVARPEQVLGPLAVTRPWREVLTSIEGGAAAAATAAAGSAIATGLASRSSSSSWSQVSSARRHESRHVAVLVRVCGHGGGATSPALTAACGQSHARACPGTFKVRRVTWAAGVGVGFLRPSRRHRRRRVSSYVGLPAVAVASRGRAVYMNGVNYDGVGRLEPRLTFWRSCYAG